MIAYGIAVETMARIGSKQVQEIVIMDIESNSVNEEEWSGVNSEGGGGDFGDGSVSIFMKLEKRDDPYRVRLVWTPHPFRKHWAAFNALRQYPISPAWKVENKDQDVAWIRGGFCPRRRFVVVVLDHLSR